MGQRHQVFVIAKVGRGNQRQYRCVAAFHWQWLYGPEPPRAATRFINSIKNPLNERLIRADLEAFDDYTARTSRWNQAVPCPYISALYRMSTRIGVDHEYDGKCFAESADMASNGGDNDGGISIIDITDPISPRYCMMFLWEGQAAARYLYRPLSAKEYVERYEPCTNPETSAERDEAASIREAYEGLLGVPLIDMATLAETWPREYSAPSPQNRWEVGNYAPDSDDSDINVVNGAKTIGEGPGYEEKIPSLAKMAIFKAVQAILQDEDNADQIHFLLQLPMGQELIDAVIASLTVASQLPDYILPVLAKVLIPSPIDGYTDFSQFALSGHQICQVAKMIPSCKILKLGGHINGEIDDIVNMIKCLPELDTVMLFDDLITVEQLTYLRQELPSDRIRIAHREEYFKYVNHDGPQYTPRNVQEFTFIFEKYMDGWGDNLTFQTRGVGVEVLDDPNFIIQTVRDFLRVKYRFDAATIGFSTNKREYGVPFASSAFVSIASPEAKLERENPDRVQWGFVCHETHGYPRVLKYGFFRYQHGSPLQVMDVDGFVTALSKERPDLPPVMSGSARPGVQFTSFLDEVRYLLRPKSRDQTEKERPIVLLSVKQAEEIILGL